MTQRTDDAQAREGLERGFDLLRADRPAEAGAVFSGLLDSPSVAARAAYGSGLAHFAQGNDEAAGVLFSRAVALDPADANAVYYVGCLAERRGDVNEAREQYRRVLRINPQHYGARDKLQPDPAETAAATPSTIPEPRPSDQYAPAVPNQEAAGQPAPAYPQPGVSQAQNDQVDDGAGRSSWRDVGRDVLPVVVALIGLVLASVVADLVLRRVADNVIQSHVPTTHLVLAESVPRILATWVLVGLGLLIWRPRRPAGRLTLLALVIATLLAGITAASDTTGSGSSNIAQPAALAAGIVLVAFALWKALTARPRATRSGAMQGSAAPTAPVPQQRDSYVGYVSHLHKGVSYPRKVIGASPLPSAKQDWSFVVELKDQPDQQATGYKTVQLCGSRIMGVLEEGDKVEISRRERESHGTIRARRIRNLTYGGSEVTTSNF